MEHGLRLGQVLGAGEEAGLGVEVDLVVLMLPLLSAEVGWCMAESQCDTGCCLLN